MITDDWRTCPIPQGRLSTATQPGHQPCRCTGPRTLSPCHCRAHPPGSYGISKAGYPILIHIWIAMTATHSRPLCLLCAHQAPDPRTPIQEKQSARSSLKPRTPHTGYLNVTHLTHTATHQPRSFRAKILPSRYGHLYIELLLPLLPPECSGLAKPCRTQLAITGMCKERADRSHPNFPQGLTGRVFHSSIGACCCRACPSAHIRPTVHQCHHDCKFGYDEASPTGRRSVQFQLLSISVLNIARVVLITRAPTLLTVVPIPSRIAAPGREFDRH